jgi:hypothetical protein
MKSNRLFPLTIVAGSLCALAFITATPLHGETSWDRQAYGQQHYVPGHEGDPLYSYNYPNNNNWSQVLTFQYDNSNPPKPLYEIAPSNWSTSDYPNGNVDVTLGNTGLGANNAPTNLDLNGISLNSLTVQADGGLNMQAGTSLSANFFNFQGNNSSDATLTVGGGGGAWPRLILPPGGTMKKTTGTSTFMLDSNIQLQVDGGGTIACDAGALQLPGNGNNGGGTRYAGGVNFNAATGALIDLAPADAVDSSTIPFTGPMTGINTGGTVRFNKGWIRTVGGTGGSTLNFGGDTFQWQGGHFNGSAADPFVNVGTINITGSVLQSGGGGFVNQGTVIQSGAGTMDIRSGSFINALGAVYDIRNTLPLTDDGTFLNLGTLRKSASSSTVTFDPALRVTNMGGTIDVDSGTLLLGERSYYSGGIFNVAAGGILDLADANAVDSSVNLIDGYITAPNNGGTIRLSHGWLRTAGPATFNFGGNTFQWTGGRIISPNYSSVFTNAGTINLAGDVLKGGNGGMVNQGLIIQRGAGTFASYNGGANGFINASGGIFSIRNDGGITGDDFLTNAGTLEKTAGTGTSTVTNEMSNPGTVAVSSGTLQFTGHFAQNSGHTLSGGTWSVIDSGSGATLLMNSASIFLNQGTVILSGPNSSFPAIDSLQNNSGTFEITNSRNFATTGDLTNSGTIEVGTHSTLTANGNVLNNGLFVFFAGGQIVLPSGGHSYQVNTTTSFINNGTLDIINDAAFVFPAGFVNQGTIVDSSVVKARTISRSGTVTTLTIDSYSGHTYRLQISSSLAANSFIDIGSPLQGSTGTVLTFIDPGTSGAVGFYRIVVDS